MLNNYGHPKKCTLKHNMILYPLECLRFKTLSMPDAGLAEGHSPTAGGSVEWHSHSGKQCLTKLNMHLAQEPATPVPVLPKITDKTTIRPDNAYGSLTPNWDSPKCPSTGQLMNKLRHTHEMEKDSAIQKYINYTCESYGHDAGCTFRSRWHSR